MPPDVEPRLMSNYLSKEHNMIKYIVYDSIRYIHMYKQTFIFIYILVDR